MVGLRLTLAGLVVAVLAVGVGVTLVPTHVSFGAGSIRCGTVAHPDQESEVHSYCGRAGANQLHAASWVGAVLVVLALAPLVLGRLCGPGRRTALVIWALLFVVVAIVGVGSLGLVEYSTPHEVFQL